MSPTESVVVSGLVFEWINYFPFCPNFPSSKQWELPPTSHQEVRWCLTGWLCLPPVAKTTHEARFLQLCVELGLRNISSLLAGHIACVWSQTGEWADWRSSGMRWKDLCPRTQKAGFWFLVCYLWAIGTWSCWSLWVSGFLWKLGSWNLGKHGSLLQLGGGIYKLDSLAFNPAD